MKRTIIVIPTYNEKDNIGALIREVFEVAPESKVMIVDDNSPDGTAREVSALQKVYPGLILFSRPIKNGLGMAYKEAFAKIIGELPETEVIVMMDADFTHNPRYLPLLIQEVGQYDMVIGSAFLHREGLSQYPLLRALLSRWANFYCRQILRYNLRDWTNNFIAFKMSALKKINLSNIDVKEFAFVFGLRYGLLKCGATFKEIPVILDIRNKGQSKMKLSTVIEGIIAPWKLKLKSRKLTSPN